MKKGSFRNSTVVKNLHTDVGLSTLELVLKCINYFEALRLYLSP